MLTRSLLLVSILLYGGLTPSIALESQEYTFFEDFFLQNPPSTTRYLEGWNTTDVASACEWSGVTCNDNQTHVIRL